MGIPRAFSAFPSYQSAPSPPRDIGPTDVPITVVVGASGCLLRLEYKDDQSRMTLRRPTARDTCWYSAVDVDAFNVCQGVLSSIPSSQNRSFISGKGKSGCPETRPYRSSHTRSRCKVSEANLPHLQCTCQMGGNLLLVVGSARFACGGSNEATSRVDVLLVSFLCASFLCRAWVTLTLVVIVPDVLASWTSVRVGFARGGLQAQDDLKPNPTGFQSGVRVRAGFGYLNNPSERSPIASSGCLGAIVSLVKGDGEGMIFTYMGLRTVLPSLILKFPTEWRFFRRHAARWKRESTRGKGTDDDGARAPTHTSDASSLGCRLYGRRWFLNTGAVSRMHETCIPSYHGNLELITGYGASPIALRTGLCRERVSLEAEKRTQRPRNARTRHAAGQTVTSLITHGPLCHHDRSNTLIE